MADEKELAIEVVMTLRTSITVLADSADDAAKKADVGDWANDGITNGEITDFEILSKPKQVYP